VRLKHAASTLLEAAEVPRDLLLGRYPEFVTGGPLPRGDVPVFVFHSLEPESFGRKIEYLSRNGYVTLSADDYYHGLLGGRPFPERSIVLTFDDGRGSLWSVGAPLLKRFGMRGIVFLVPGRMRSDHGPLGPTLDDVSSGRAPTSAITDRETGDGAFLSWAEVGALARSGVFDFESHTLLHSRIHIAADPVGFVTPEMRRGYAAFDVPLVRDHDIDLLADRVPLGTPILRSAPRTSEELRFFEAADVRAPCVDEVAAGGGEAFFRRPDWQARLRTRLGKARLTGAVETPAEREQAIRLELAEARRLIEEQTGRPPVHLCYPWHASGPTARRLARETGYRSAYWGKVPGVRLTRAGGDPFSIARIGEDYVELLPGRDRRSLLEVLRRKWARRFSPA
jgi:peptidoglycan/xylan/chitin deacetylase (PgdA/CDA1 family)